MGSWLFAILPFIEQQAAFSSRAWTTPISIYICPSRRSAAAQTIVAADEFGNYVSGGWEWGRRTTPGPTPMFRTFEAGTNPCRTLVGITDGTSQTLLAGRRRSTRRFSARTTGTGTSRSSSAGPRHDPDGAAVIMRDAPGNVFKQNWGSAHTGGANFLLADGSVRLFRHDSPWTVIGVLLTPAGGEVTPPDE